MNRIITTFIRRSYLPNFSQASTAKSQGKGKILLYQISNNKNYASFSTDKPGQIQITQQDLSDVRLVRGTANYFYRNSLRILTETNHPSNSVQMSRVVKLSKTKKDGILLFEAYFNYIGRKTIMPNQIIDKLLLKAMSILKKDLNKEQIEQEINRDQADRKIRQKILQFINMHDYLHYFPHYDVTQSLIEQFLSKPSETEHIKKFARILKQKRLIKHSQKCFNLLVDGLKNQEIQEQARKFIFNTVISRVLFLWNNPDWTQDSLRDISRLAIQNMCQNQSVVILNQISEKQLYLEKVEKSLESTKDKDETKLILSALYLLINNQAKAFDHVESVSNFDSKQGKAFLLCLRSLRKSQNEAIDQNYLQQRSSVLKKKKKISFDSQ